MSSDTSGIDNSFLSPVSSPAPQAKQHTSTNLTGDPRKVKDLAADFHNLMRKWKALNSEGMDIISKIANIKIERVFNLTEQESGTVRLPQELNPLCDLLCDTVDRMVYCNVLLSPQATSFVIVI
uniref:Uncharacterized protein n=1 Tax=Arion vulgaris TaxID=1028688 RepID=A0A0B6ZD55_9EUPU